MGISKVEVVRVTDEGRYVWDVEDSRIEYIPKGERNVTRTLPLYRDSNSFNGAIRVAARDIMREHQE
jgi:hypothetical protein